MAARFVRIPRLNVKIIMLSRNGFRIAFVLSISPMSLHDLRRTMIFEGVEVQQRNKLLLEGLTDLCRAGLLVWSFEPDYGNKPAIRPLDCGEKSFLQYWHEFIEKSDLSVDVPDSQNPTLSLEGTPALNEELNKCYYDEYRRELNW